MAYDPENDDTADAANQLPTDESGVEEELDDDTCTACNQPLNEHGECDNPFCTENPENLLDDDEIDDSFDD